MKTKITLGILALICFVSLSATPQSKPSQWEYKFSYDCNEKKANSLAAEGWELVAIEGTSDAGLGHNVSAYVFKRPKSLAIFSR